MIENYQIENKNQCTVEPFIFDLEISVQRVLHHQM